MSEEHFNQALPVLRGAFLWGGLRGVFLPLAGACGRRGFWAWACACDSRDARARASAQVGRSASQAKALGHRQGRAFFPPFLWRSKERGRGGGGGAQPPRRGVGFPCVPCYGRDKTHLHGTALLASRRGTPRIAARRYNNRDATRHVATESRPALRNLS